VSAREYYRDEQVTLLLGDALEVLRGMPDESVHCVVTSPPYYGLRDYGVDGQYGLETTPAAYVETMRQVFAEVRRVLAADGTCWVNLDDSYAYPPGSAGRQGNGQRKGRTFTAEGLRGTRALPPKNLMLIPERLAIALQDDGWTIRNRIVWHATNSQPESVTDRLAHRYETLLLLTRSKRYWFDLDAIRERQKTAGERHEGRSCGSGEGWPSEWAAKTRTLNPKGGNPGDVWVIPTRPYPEAHFAVFPIDLPVRCIKAGCKPGGTVLDPFSGSGTTGAASRQLGHPYIGIDLKPAYHDLAIKRYAQGVLDLSAGAA
jgi:site-specific DNA-methyltransferase (cytosine-N4-specific)